MKLGRHFERAIRARLAMALGPNKRKKLGQLAIALFWLLAVSFAAIVLTAITVAMDPAPLTIERVVAVCVSGIASGLFGTITTVVSLEVLRARRAEQAQRTEHLARLRSTDRATVSSVIEELRGKGLLEGGYLDGSDLAGVNFAGLNLRGARFVRSKLDGADLRDTMLYAADLRFASLKDVKVSESTNLYLCHLEGAALSGIDADLLTKYGLASHKSPR